MDGRPHPPAYAPHSWSGSPLAVARQHVGGDDDASQGAYLRRNGASFSDKSTMMEYLTRHGDYLLVTMIITDPVWLEEPFIQTTHYQYDPATVLSYYPCHGKRREHTTAVPHFLPGQIPT